MDLSRGLGDVYKRQALDAAPMAVEFLFNGVVAQLARELGIDQVNWPGKGLDGPLYQFSGNH
jgi:hypothetical protein